MDKINFQNLPNTTTPVSAGNLNLLQTNVENAINGVVESGSNSNGYYVKFDDGTMIQCGEATKTIATNAALTSGGYRSSGFTFDFPIDFYEPPKSVVANSVSINLDANGVLITSSSTTKSRFQAVWWSINSNSTSRDGVIMWQAIGRWKA